MKETPECSLAPSTTEGHSGKRAPTRPRVSQHLDPGLPSLWDSEGVDAWCSSPFLWHPSEWPDLTDQPALRRAMPAVPGPTWAPANVSLAPARKGSEKEPGFKRTLLGTRREGWETSPLR